MVWARTSENVDWAAKDGGWRAAPDPWQLGETEGSYRIGTTPSARIEPRPEVQSGSPQQQAWKRLSEGQAEHLPCCKNRS